MKDQALAAAVGCEEREKWSHKDSLSSDFFLVVVAEQISQSRHSRKTSSAVQMVRAWTVIGFMRSAVVSPLSLLPPLPSPRWHDHYPLRNYYPASTGRPSPIDPTRCFVRFDFSSHFSHNWKTAQLRLGEREEVDGHRKAGKHKQRHAYRCYQYLPVKGQRHDRFSVIKQHFQFVKGPSSKIPCDQTEVHPSLICAKLWLEHLLV